MLTNVLSASHAVPSQPFGQIPKCCTSRATGHAWLVDTGLSVKVRRNRRRMMRNRSGSALVTSYISNSFCESIRLSRLMQATGRNASSLRFAHACKLAIRRLCPTRLLVFGHGEICAQERLCLLASPKQHLPAGAYSAAIKECGYRPPSISSSDKMSKVVSNMVCNREGGDLMEKFLIEEEEAMGERHLLIFVEVDTKEVVRMETYYFEQQVSATLKQLQREAKRAEAKEEEKIEKADTDAGKETEDDESEKEPEAKPERKGGAEGGAEGAAAEAGAIAWSILKAQFNATRTSSYANLSDANPEAQTVEHQSLRKMNKQEDKKVDKSVNQSESKLLKHVKAQYNAIFPLMQFGLAVLLAWARPRDRKSVV